MLKIEYIIDPYGDHYSISREDCKALKGIATFFKYKNVVVQDLKNSDLFNLAWRLYWANKE